MTIGRNSIPTAIPLLLYSNITVLKKPLLFIILNYLFISFVNPNNLKLRIWIVPVFYVRFSAKKTWASFAHVGTLCEMWVVKISEQKKNENLKNQWKWLRQTTFYCTILQLLQICKKLFALFIHAFFLLFLSFLSLVF